MFVDFFDLNIIKEKIEKNIVEEINDKTKELNEIELEREKALTGTWEQRAFYTQKITTLYAEEAELQKNLISLEFDSWQKKANTEFLSSKISHRDIALNLEKCKSLTIKDRLNEFKNLKINKEHKKGYEEILDYFSQINQFILITRDGENFFQIERKKERENFFLPKEFVKFFIEDSLENFLKDKFEEICFKNKQIKSKILSKNFGVYYRYKKKTNEIENKKEEIENKKGNFVIINLETGDNISFVDYEIDNKTKGFMKMFTLISIFFHFLRIVLIVPKYKIVEKINLGKFNYIKIEGISYLKFIFEFFYFEKDISLLTEKEDFIKNGLSLINATSLFLGIFEKILDFRESLISNIKPIENGIFKEIIFKRNERRELLEENLEKERQEKERQEKEGVIFFSLHDKETKKKKEIKKKNQIFFPYLLISVFFYLFLFIKNI